MKLEAHELRWLENERKEAIEAGMDPDYLGYVQPASQESVAYVLAQSEEGDDGRSNWLWVRLSNGDLILGVFPQGDTYFATEEDHSTPPDWGKDKETT